MKFSKYLYSSLLLVGCIFLSFDSGYAQSKQMHHIEFRPTIDGKDLVLGSYQRDNVRIDKFKMYVGSISIKYRAQSEWTKPSNYFLLNANQPESLHINLALNESNAIDSIQFSMGVDSITHALGAMGGCLDPINGMYWTWQSGYINMKLEGTCSICPTHGNTFEFHIGGYKTEYNTHKVLQLAISQTAENIIIDIELSPFIDQLYGDAEAPCRVMSPGEKAVTLSKLLVQHVKIDQ